MTRPCPEARAACSVRCSSAVVYEAAALAQRRELAGMEAALQEAATLAPTDLDVQGCAWGHCRATVSLLTENRDRALQELATGVRLIQQSQATVSPPFLGLYPLLVAVAGEGRQARTEAVRLRSSDATRHQIVADLLRCVDAVLAGREGPRSGRGDSVVPPDLLAQRVTSREVDVLNLVTEGLTNAELAARLHLSPRTVEKHVASLLAKTGCRRRAQLVAYVVRLSG